MRKVKTIIYIFLGTTAELIKLVPVIKEFQRRKVKYRIVLSGQTDINFQEFNKLIGRQKIYFSFRSINKKLSPLHLALWTIKTTLTAVSWGRKEFAQREIKKDLFLVQGDTVTAVIGAIIARLNHLKLAHIEAGYRSHNFLEPFPEEICRTLVDRLADINFCSNKWNCQNSKRNRGVNIDTNWNTSVESLSLALKFKMKPDLLKSLRKKAYFIFLLHRQEHMFIRKDETRNLTDLILKQANKNHSCLFIIHKVTQKYLSDMGLEKEVYKNKSIIPTPGLPFLEFIHVLKNSEFIVSDGGGNQQEAHFLGKPLLILRRATEQREGIGENAVLSREDPKIINAFFKNYKKLRRSKARISVWPSKIIVDELVKF